MTFNQYHNSFNHNINPYKPNNYITNHNGSRSISNVFNNNNRTLPLPVKSSPYKYEKEYAILALNSKKMYKAKHIPKVMNTMNYDNSKNKTFRSKSTSLEDVNKNTLFNFKKEELPNEKLSERSESNLKNIHNYNPNNTCVVCEKVCQSPSALKIHMAIHSDGKPFKCFFCDKFISKFASNRNRHMKQVHQWDNGRKK